MGGLEEGRGDLRDVGGWGGRGRGVVRVGTGGARQGVSAHLQGEEAIHHPYHQPRRQ